MYFFYERILMRFYEKLEAFIFLLAHVENEIVVPSFAFKKETNG